MKKLIVLIVLLACSSSLFAQEVDSYGIPVNSINVEVSDALVPTVISALGVGIGTALGAAFAAVISGGNATIDAPQFRGWIPFISAQYEYHFPDTRWSVGPELSYWHYGLENNTSYMHLHLPALTAAGKFYYKPEGICKLYGGLSLGAEVFFSTTVKKSVPETKAEGSDTPDAPVDSGENNPSGNASFLPAFQITPIGMRLGGDKAAFVAELGVGYKGFLSLGANIAL